MRRVALAALLTAALIPITAVPIWADDDAEGGFSIHCRPEISLRFDADHRRVIVTADPDDRWYHIDVGSAPDGDAAGDPEPVPDVTPPSEEPVPDVTPPSEEPVPDVTPPSDEPVPDVTPPSTDPTTTAVPGAATVSRESKKWWCRRIAGDVTVRNETTGETTSYSVQAPDSDRRVFPGAIHGGDRIVARIDQGGGSDRAELTLPATRPSTPRNLIATQVTDTSAMVDWTAPEFSGGLPVTGYRVWADGRRLSDSPVTSAEVTGLSPDADHVIEVAAVNARGASDSVALHVRTDPAPTVPGRPEALESPDATQTTVTLRWQPPANTGGRPITGYRVSDNGVHVDVVTGTTAVIKRLDAGTLHTFAVQAVNAIGIGPAASLSAWTNMNPVPMPKAPGAPRDVTLTATAGTVMSVTWRAPKNPGSTPIDSYLVDIAGTRYEVTSGTSLVVPGLEPATRYEAAVRAVNSMGPGPAATGSGWTPLVPVPKPVTRPSPPRHLRSTATSQTSIALAWQAPADDGGEPVSAYLLSWGEGRAAYVTDLSETVTRLEPGTRYSFDLRALNSAGQSDPVTLKVWTDMRPVPTPTPPSEPRDLAAPTVTKTAMLLTWSPPATDGGVEVTDYLVVWGTGASMVTTGTSAYIANLTPGTLYDVSVVARNAMGTSASATLPVWTVYEPVPTPQVPTPPRDLRILGATVSSLLLDWARPVSDGGNPITGYAVFVNGTYNRFVDVTSAAVGALAADTPYTFEVRAVNAMGMSDAVSGSGRTLAAPAPAPVPPQPRPDAITPVVPAGTVDVDGDARTVRQTVRGAWPARTRLLSGRSTLLERKANLVTNAGQDLKVAVTYRSPSIKSTRIVLDRRTGEYALTAVLKPGKVSGAVVLTATAPATKVGGTRYERLQSSKRFTILDNARGR